MNLLIALRTSAITRALSISRLVDGKWLELGVYGPTGKIRAEPFEAVENMLMMRVATRWRFLVIPRVDLLAIRAAYVESTRKRRGPGRRPLTDEGAKVDTLRLEVGLDGNTIKGWNASLSKYLDQWPEELAVVQGGPGSIGMHAAPDLTDSSAADPDRSQDPET